MCSFIIIIIIITYVFISSARIFIFFVFNFFYFKHFCFCFCISLYTLCGSSAHVASRSPSSLSRTAKKQHKGPGTESKDKKEKKTNPKKKKSSSKRDRGMEKWGFFSGGFREKLGLFGVWFFGWSEFLSSSFGILILDFLFLFFKREENFGDVHSIHAKVIQRLFESAWSWYSAR